MKSFEITTTTAETEKTMQAESLEQIDLQGVVDVDLGYPQPEQTETVYFLLFSWHAELPY